MDLATFSRAVFRLVRPVVVPVVRILVRQRFVRRAIRLAITPFPRLRMRLQRLAFTLSTDPGPGLRITALAGHGDSEAGRFARQLDRAFAGRRDGGR